MTLARSSLFFLLAGCCFGQVTATVGPAIAPINGYLGYAVANDTATPVTLSSLCPWQVRDSNGVVVLTPSGCLPFPPVVYPGSVINFIFSTASLAAGTYYVDVFLPGPVTSTTTVVLDPQAQAGIVNFGPLRPGTTRTIFVDSPGNQGRPYLMAASYAPVATGIPTCQGVVPLNDDPVLALTTGPNPYCTAFYSNLNPTGQGWYSAVTLPPDPSIIGTQLAFACVVLDFSQPCIIHAISSPMTLQIQ